MPKSKPPQSPQSQPKSQPDKPAPPATTAPGNSPSTKTAARTASKPTPPAETPAPSAHTSAPQPLTALAATTPLALANASAAVIAVTAADIDTPPDAATLADPAQQAIARAKYQALHNKISATRETLPGDDTANRTLLRDRAEEAQDVLTTLDRNDLQANTPAFNAAATQIQKANSDMDDLKNSIGGIIHNIQAVADFEEITNQAVSAAAKFIA